MCNRLLGSKIPKKTDSQKKVIFYVASLLTPIKKLNNQSMKRAYIAFLFAFLCKLVMGQAPTFDTVNSWSQLEAYSSKIKALYLNDTLRGNRWFHYEASGTPDSGTVAPAWGTGGGFWISETNNSSGIPVAWFGALNDGSTDGTTSWTAAINYAVSHNVALILSKGVWLTQQQKLGGVNGLTIWGQSRDSTIIRLVGGSSTGVAVFNIGNASHIHLSHLTLDANSPNQTGANVYCFYASQGTNYIITDLNFEDVSFVNSVGGNASLLLLANYNVSTTIIKDVYINHCYFNNSQGSSLQIRGVSGFWLTNSIIKQWGVTNKSSVPAFGMTSLPDSNVHVINNFFQNTDSATEFAIESSGNIVNSDISNNTFDGNNEGANGISGYWNNCTFSNNKQINGTGGERGGMEIVGTNISISNPYIDNGQISFFGEPNPGGTLAGSFGDKLSIVGGSITNKVTNDDCITLSGSGADSNGARNVVISDIVLIDSASSIGSGSPAIAVAFYGSQGFAHHLKMNNLSIWANSNNAGIRFYNTAAADTIHDVDIHNCRISNALNGILFDNATRNKNIQIFDNDLSACTTSIGFTSGSYTAQYSVWGNTTSAQPNSLSIINSKVGIGTSLPQYNLDIAGDEHISTNLTMENNANSGFIQFWNIQRSSTSPYLYLNNLNYFVAGNLLGDSASNSWTEGDFYFAHERYDHDTTITANYAATINDYYIRVNAAGGNITVTLPTASSFHRTFSDGRQYSAEIHIKRIDNSANTVTIMPQSGQTIDGTSSITLTSLQNNVYKAGTTASWDID